MAEGHQYAPHYPLSKLWIEAEIARERINGRITTEATMMHSVIASILSTDGGVDNLKNIMRELTDGN